ncbi:MAG: hypothetical protein KKE05_00510 [Nanoarchaeota archaeon]|nr:hypothetical protein [Nanoarchaeota archaeon]
MKDKIKLGYEIKTAKEVNIVPSHLIVTGITQLSGKTTTLEALIKRSGLKAVIFKTKIGEKSFTEGTETAPFFRDRSDYEFVKSLIEAYAKEKLFLEKGTLMRLCKGSVSLIDIKKRVDDELASGKLRGLKEEIHTRLQHYLENLIPQIQYANLSKTLDIREGINIMNLERFSEEAQSLIIQSVADEVLKTMKGVIIVIPEAWKFLPQKYNNPCKRVVESFIRQGATNKNFVWIDSQDMAGVDKIPLKQISTWILGYQSERNEVKHTLDQISLPKKMKPKEEEIMNLKKGHFFLSCYEGVYSVYVQPSWLSDEDAIKIAKGKLDVDKIEAPDNLIPYSRPTQEREQGKVEIRFDDSKIRKDMIELRQDFFNKIQELQNFEQKLAEQIYTLKSQSHKVNEDEIISKVLQKIPSFNGETIDKDLIIKEVLLRIPKSTGNVVYEVAPIEKIKKDFLEEAKQKILSDVSTLSNNAKRTLKYLESRGVGCSVAEICIKGFMYKDGGGGYSKIVNDAMKELSGIIVGEKQTNGKCFGRLRERIKQLLEVQEAKPEEMEQVYNHIVMEILKNGGTN